jgi:hypothetical protein
MTHLPMSVREERDYNAAAVKMVHLGNISLIFVVIANPA